MDPIVCKCCGNRSEFRGAIDFNKTCHDRFGERVFGISQILVNYFACIGCGFIFTPDMDEWSVYKFAELIYNEDYSKADGAIPGFEHTSRKESFSYKNGMRLAEMLDGSQSEITLLDFGAGGNPGDTGLALIDRGFNVSSFDPHISGVNDYPKGKFDFVYLIEVIEHCHNVDEVAAWISKHLARDGIVHIQTLLHGFPTAADVLSSWYIAPRNGHISIFTLQALTLLFRKFGINIVQTVFGVIGFKEKPKFANKYFV